MDNDLVPCIPKATDSIYDLYQVKIGNEVLDRGRFKEPNYLGDRVRCLHKDRRIDDAVAALCDPKASVLCCVTGDYANISPNSPEVFDLFLKTAKRREADIAQASAKKIYGYDRSEVLFRELKQKANNPNLTFSSVTLDCGASDKLTTLLSSVGKVKRVKKDLDEVFERLQAEKGSLDGEIEELERLKKDLMQRLSATRTQIAQLSEQSGSADNSGKEQEQLNREIDDLKEQLKTLQGHMQTAKKKVVAFKSDIEKLEKEIERAEQAAEEDISLVKEVEEDAKEIKKQTQEINKKLAEEKARIKSLIDAKQTSYTSASRDLSEMTKRQESLDQEIATKASSLRTATKGSGTFVAERRRELEEKEKKLKEELDQCERRLLERHQRAETVRKRMAAKKTATNVDEWELPPEMKEQAKRCMGSVDETPTESVVIPAKVSVKDMKIFFEKALTPWAGKIKEIKVEAVDKRMIDSFVEFLRQPDIALTKLDLSKANLEDDDAIPLLTALRDNPGKLTLLNLCENKLTGRSMAVLSEFMDHNRTIQAVYLSHNPIGDEGIRALAAVIGSVPKLNIWWEGIKLTMEGLRTWASAVSTHPNLFGIFRLPSSRVCLKDLGPDALRVLEPLLLNPVVSQIFLNPMDGVNDQFVENLCDILRKRINAKSIDLRFRSEHPFTFGKKGLQAIEALVQCQPTCISHIVIGEGALDVSGLDYFPTFYQKVAVHANVDFPYFLGKNAARLERMLRVMKELNVVDIEFIFQDDDAVQRFCQYLQDNSSYCEKLEKLSVHNYESVNCDPLIMLIESGKMKKLCELDISYFGDTLLGQLANALVSGKLKVQKLHSVANVSLAALVDLLQKIQSANLSVEVEVSNINFTSKDADKIFKLFSSDFIEKALVIRPYKGWENEHEFDLRLSDLLKNRKSSILIDGKCDLSRQGLTDVKFGEFVDKLKAHKGPALKCLDVSENEITAAGLNRFINEYLFGDEARIEQLKVLKLSNNPLTDAAKDALLRLLQHPRCGLEEIHLVSVGMRAVALNPILAAQKTTLKVCSIGGNDLRGVVVPGSSTATKTSTLAASKK